MQQTSVTDNTRKRTEDLLDYVVTHPDAKIRYRALSMILQIHTDVSYLSEPKARSRTVGHYFLGCPPPPSKSTNPPQQHNLHVVHRPKVCSIIRGGSRVRGIIFKHKRRASITTYDGRKEHPQPPTPIHCNNATTVGIVNKTVKKKHRSRPMEIRYFYSCDQVKRGNFDVQWHPGLECLGYYPSKHHIALHHQNVQPIYLHTKYSPLFLTRAPKPSDLRGCVGKTLAGYKRWRPLPVLPRMRP